MNAVTGIEQLDEKQRLAVDRALDMSRRIAAITGPAGSGKTTIMKFVYGSLVAAGYSPVIVAPTGKAARRVREATGYQAQTIHMLLEYTRPTDIDEKTGKPYGDTYPRRTREKPIEYDHVLCDEYAMVNHELHRNLIDALPPGCRLIAFGDNSQLPPIEAPALASKPTPFTAALQRFDGVVLDRVHRQAGDSGILSNAQRILNGMAPVTTADFVRVITDKPIDALMEVLDQADFTSMDNQIITPSNKSWIGTVKLNQTLQASLMDGTRHTIALPRHKWDKVALNIGVGDKIILTKNWYDLECEDGTKGVFNGEVGKVIEVSELEEVVVDFGDRICRIPPAVQLVYQNQVTVGYPQKDLYLAYAVTTHKAQGSEYQHVVYVVNRSVITMLNRRNLYTAITRAKKHVTFIADMQGLSISVTQKEPRVFAE